MKGNFFSVKNFITFYFEILVKDFINDRPLWGSPSTLLMPSVRRNIGCYLLGVD